MEKLETAENTPTRSQFRTVLHQVFDSFRTAPFGFMLAGLGTFDVPLVSLSHDYSSVPSPVLGIMAGIYITRKQYQLRRRLENICQKRGYSDRAFQLTTKEWCDRQTARIAAQNAGKLDEYQNLCQQYEAKSNFTKLPHF